MSEFVVQKEVRRLVRSHFKRQNVGYNITDIYNLCTYNCGVGVIRNQR